MVWVALGAGVAVVVAAVTVKRLLAAARREPTNTDLGSVSDGWLSDNRARKDL
jgi:hypothetical protein